MAAINFLQFFVDGLFQALVICPESMLYLGTNIVQIPRDFHCELAYENLVHIAWAASKGSDEPAHPRSLARALAFYTCQVLK